MRDRFGSRMLALAFALTGIVATMPYIALQLVGMEVVIGALGFPAGGFVGHLPLIIAFIILAAFTYTSGLRAPALIAVVKDMLIFITVFAAVVIIPAKLGGYGAIFASVPPEKLILAPPSGDNLGAYSAYATLGARLGARAVSLPARHDRDLELLERQRDPAERGAARGLFLHPRADRAARLHGDRRRRR